MAEKTRRKKTGPRHPKVTADLSGVESWFEKSGLVVRAMKLAQLDQDQIDEFRREIMQAPMAEIDSIADRWVTVTR